MKCIVIGGGNTGSYVAGLLLKSNCTVRIIENRDDVLQKLRAELPAEVIVPGSGTDPGLLEAAGVADADVVAAVTGSDEVNLVASTIAKFEYGVRRVVARVNNPKNAWLYGAEMGVDVALNQADLMARLAVEGMALKHIFTLLELDHGGYSIVQSVVDDGAAAAGKSVRDLAFPEHALLIAIFRGKDVVIPRGSTVIEAGDQILAFGNAVARPAISALFSAG